MRTRLRTLLVTVGGSALFAALLTACQVGSGGSGGGHGY